MGPRFEYGDPVRVIRPLRNDGTFPGKEKGELLVPRGATGFVRDIGTFLQDQVIYSVHFLDHNQLVGCREEELIGADEPWIASRFDTREWVAPEKALAVAGEVVVAAGTAGQVLRVIREQPVAYQIRFPGRTLQVPESVLRPAEADEALGLDE